MRRSLGALILPLALTGCAPSLSVSDRGEVIRRILPSAVQLRVEREGGKRRAGSGVIVASDRTSGRFWVVTTRHLLEPLVEQEITVRSPRRREAVRATIRFLSPDADVAVVEVEGLEAGSVTLKASAMLGDEVWIVAFPWGRRMTLVNGVVSQITGDVGVIAYEGPVRMVDASVSYGASGGAVFDAASGTLVGIVEGYRTARVSVPEAPDRALEVPVPGETTIIPAATIVRALRAAGLTEFMPAPTGK